VSFYKHSANSAPLLKLTIITATLVATSRSTADVRARPRYRRFGFTSDGNALECRSVWRPVSGMDATIAAPSR